LVAAAAMAAACKDDSGDLLCALCVIILTLLSLVPVHCHPCLMCCRHQLTHPLVVAAATGKDDNGDGVNRHALMLRQLDNFGLHQSTAPT